MFSREVPRLSLRDENEREGVADNEVDMVVAGLLMPRELPVIEEQAPIDGSFDAPLLVHPRRIH